MIRAKCARCGEIGASHIMDVRIEYKGENVLPINKTLSLFLCPACAPMFDPECKTPLFPDSDGKPLLTAVAKVQEIQGWNVDEEEGE